MNQDAAGANCQPAPPVISTGLDKDSPEPEHIKADHFNAPGAAHIEKCLQAKIARIPRNFHEDIMLDRLGLLGILREDTFKDKCKQSLDLEDCVCRVEARAERPEDIFNQLCQVVLPTFYGADF